MGSVVGSGCPARRRTLGVMDRPDARFWGQALGALARHPSLWPTAIGQAGRLASDGWWRRAPFLPIPDREYLAFRMETQYGSAGDPEPEDLVVYLGWCRQRAR